MFELSANIRQLEHLAKLFTRFALAVAWLINIDESVFERTTLCAEVSAERAGKEYHLELQSYTSVLDRVCVDALLALCFMKEADWEQEELCLFPLVPSLCIGWDDTFQWELMIVPFMGGASDVLGREAATVQSEPGKETKGEIQKRREYKEQLWNPRQYEYTF